MRSKLSSRRQYKGRGQNLVLTARPLKGRRITGRVSDKEVD